MDVTSVNGIAALATDMSAQKTQAAISTTMLRKALDVQQQSALSLLQALPQPVSSNPPNLGNSVNVRA